jgi:hypothetical protein
MKSEDVLPLFEKWYSEKTEVLCASHLYGWAVSFLCKVSEPPTASEVSFDSGNGGFKLKLDTPGMSFSYKEPKDLEGLSPSVKGNLPPELLELSFLSVVFPLRILLDEPAKSQPDILFLAEIPERIDTEGLLR